MNTKLTLRIDKETKNKIKHFAENHHISISKLTERLFENIIVMEKSINKDLSPVSKKYKGILQNTKLDYDELKYKYLKEKYE